MNLPTVTPAATPAPGTPGTSHTGAGTAQGEVATAAGFAALIAGLLAPATQPAPAAQGAVSDPTTAPTDGTEATGTTGTTGSTEPPAGQQPEASSDPAASQQPATTPSPQVIGVQQPLTTPATPTPGVAERAPVDPGPASTPPGAPERPLGHPPLSQPPQPIQPPQPTQSQPTPPVAEPLATPGAATPADLTTQAPPASESAPERAPGQQQAPPLQSTQQTTQSTQSMPPTPTVPSMPGAPVPTDGATAARPVPVADQLAPEMTRLVSRGDGVHRLTMRLQPEALGEVRVTLTVRHGEVHVRFAGGDDAQRALLEGAPELRRVLELAGAHETRVVVRDLAATSQQFGQQLGQQSSSTGHSSAQDPTSGGGPGQRSADDASAPDQGREGNHDHHARTRGGITARDGLTDGSPGTPPHRLEPARQVPRGGLDLTM